jgi:hypothetical protein
MEVLIPFSSFFLPLVVTLNRQQKAPIVIPDVRIGKDRNSIPYIIGEVDVSDIHQYIRIKSRLWINHGAGNVRFLL